MRAMFSRRSLALAATAVIVSGAALPVAAAETIKLVATTVKEMLDE